MVIRIRDLPVLAALAAHDLSRRRQLTVRRGRADHLRVGSATWQRQQAQLRWLAERQRDGP